MTHYPAPESSRIGHPIRIAALRRGLLDRQALGQISDRLLARQQGVVRPRHAPAGKDSQRPVALIAEATPYQNPVMHPVMRLSPPPAMTDDGNLSATRALPGEPLTVLLARLAFVARTWDKNNHPWREGPVLESHSPRHMTPECGLRT